MNWSIVSQLAEPLRTGPGVKSGNSVRELISTLKKKKKKIKSNNAQAGNEWWNILLPKSSQASKQTNKQNATTAIVVYHINVKAWRTVRTPCVDPSIESPHRKEYIHWSATPA